MLCLLSPFLLNIVSVTMSPFHWGLKKATEAKGLANSYIKIFPRIPSQNRILVIASH